MSHAIALFAAGCFWGVEAQFSTIAGVISTAVGYSGGTKAHPTYEEVCSGTTGHAEVVRIEYDPDKVSYEELLNVFWSTHNPTTKDRQGPDVGSQYRSAIFYQDEEQNVAAMASKEARSELGLYPDPIVTEITQASEFYLAEDYHQQYLAKQGH
jgi:peptide-methionine (S)-S-oxide reductase